MKNHHHQHLTAKFARKMGEAAVKAALALIIQVQVQLNLFMTMNRKFYLWK